MQIWHGLESIRQPFVESSVAIGMFDGLHVGHQSLIRVAVADARGRRAAVVFTFDRHPAEVVAPDKVPGYLSVPSRRERQLAALGVDHLVVAKFDPPFRELSPESFLRFVLVGVVGARSLFVGEDFRFGQNQTGDVPYLRDAQNRWDLRVHVHPPVLVDSERASSSRVRELLRSGQVDAAARVLGGAYVLSGSVIRGERLGRQLGFPTANLELLRPQVVPADGIYAVWAQTAQGRFKGACSIGVRPAVGGTARTIETYLMDFDGDLYDAPLEIEFVARLREERGFDSLEELSAQIARDVDQARALLNGAD